MVQTVTPARKATITRICCDRCLRADDDVMEIQEYLRYSDTGGYSNRVFGDMTPWSIDLCQDCVKEVLGRWIKVGEPEF